MLLPRRVGKVLRANSQALALAREVKALGAAQRGRTQTHRQREREEGERTERERDSPISVYSCLALRPL